MVTQNSNTKKIPFAECPADNIIEKKAVYSKIMDLYQVFWIFLIGSVVGFVVETVWCLIRNGRVECRSSMILGPFTAVYGFGALVLYFGNRFLAKNNILHIFFYGAAASTVVEYFCSLFQETLFGSVSWDYSSQPFNIDGRVSLLYSIFWGLLAILWFMTIQPAFEALISKIPARIYKPLTRWLAVFLVLDAVISIAAVTRWGMRLDGIPSANIIAETLDKLFPNEFMTKIYTNMRW